MRMSVTYKNKRSLKHNSVLNYICEIQAFRIMLVMLPEQNRTQWENSSLNHVFLLL